MTTSTTPARTADLMNLNEAAAYLGKTPKQLRWLIFTDQAPKHGKIGARLAFRRRDIDAFIDAAFEQTD